MDPTIGLTAGVVDNVIVIAGTYIGASRGGSEKSAAGGTIIGAVVGASLANAVSDGVAVLLDPTMPGALGITLGCLLAMAIIPAAEALRRRKER